MRRREFLSAIPPLVAFSAQTQDSNAPTTGHVTVVTFGKIHQRVGYSIEGLRRLLVGLGYAVEVLKEHERGASDPGARITVGVTTPETLRRLLPFENVAHGILRPENFAIDATPGAIFVRGGDDRGLVFGLAELTRRVSFEKRLPSTLAVQRNPYFPVRRWSTSVSHDFGSPWDERIYIAQRFEYIKAEVFPRACDYGMNSVEINGRPGDGWDVDWVIGFEKYKPLSMLFPAGERRQRLDLVEDLARSAHDNLLEILVWSHELHLPPGFIELYPQVKGVDYPVCLSNEFLHEFLRAKYQEFFAGAPSIDGLVMSVAESGYFNLITDRGCQCDRCRPMTPQDRLRAVLNDVIAVAAERKKRIVLRTFLTSWIPDLDSHPELETIRKAYSGLPPSVWVMSKYCPIDFYGGGIADEPLIGAFPNSTVVEFSLDVEWQGRTFVPVLTPENFQRRIAHAASKKCAGAVARVDFPFPTMEPEPIFGHPNDFNAWFMGELLWDPDVPIDDSLLRWSRLKYGAEAAPLMASALRKTESITQRTFFTLGQTVINYHNMLGPVSFCDNSLWFTALSKWDPSKRELCRAFFAPDERLIAAAKQEKQDAIKAAENALAEIHQARGKLPEAEFQRRRYDFENLRDTAQLWDSLLELYLRHRQLVSSPPKPNLLSAAMASSASKPLALLLDAAGAALSKAAEMENRNGVNSWPVISPDRGISVYEFVNQILRYYIAFLTREEVEDRVTHRDLNLVFTAPLYQPDSTEVFWRSLVDFGRPTAEFGTTTELHLRWPGRLKSLHCGGKALTLTDLEGHDLRVPLSFPTREFSSSGTTNLKVSVTKRVDGLAIQKV
jgi:hypothetical protein